MKPLLISTLLPPEARAELIAAAKAPLWRRAIAIEAATARVRHKYPQFFREDDDDDALDVPAFFRKQAD